MKINVFSLLTTIVVQFVVGYLWYGVHMFGGVDIGGHTIDFLKMDVLSILLIVLTSYGLTHILETLVKTTGTKDIGGAAKLGLTFGDVVQAHVFLAPDPNKGNKMDFPGMNSSWFKYFGTADQPNKPARAAFQVGALAGNNALVEIEFIAVKKGH